MNRKSPYITPYLIHAVLFFSLLSCAKKEEKLFTDITFDSKINFLNHIEEKPDQNIFNYSYMYNGGGVAIGDLNGDDLPDIFFTANQKNNSLYLNQGNLKFEDITQASKTGGKRKSWTTGVTMADVNGDGLLDIYVCYSGTGNLESRANELFINQGVKNGIPQFKEEAAQYGLDAKGSCSTQAAFFDYDRDGDLDMFLLNHATMFYSPFFNTYKLRSKRHPYFSSQLFENEEGFFKDKSIEAGIKGGGNNFGLGISIGDINNDGWPDIYNAVDYEEQDFLYLNNKDGSFKDITKKSLAHISKNGMGSEIADINNDGLLDIFVLDMLPEDNERQKLLKGPDEYDKYQLLVDSGYFHQNMRNTLQLSMGIDEKTQEPKFSEIGQLAGISNTDWSWACLVADFDNDGWKDLFISNGFLRDFTNQDFLNFTVANFHAKYGKEVPADKLIKELPSTKVPNYLYKNNGDLTFKKTTQDWGMGEPSISSGAAFADLDNDGDLDIVVNNLNEPSKIFRNNAQEISQNNFLKLKLKAKKLNSSAIGAKVTLVLPDGTFQLAEVSPSRGFQSSVPAVLNFGIGKANAIQYISIQWPDGTYSKVEAPQINSTLSINQEDSSDPKVSIDPKGHKSILMDITDISGIDYKHQNNNYVDFKNEFLLPWQLSKQGPKMAVGDINGDGKEDLFIGGSKGNPGKMYLQTQDNKFESISIPALEKDSNFEDIQAVFIDVDNDNDLDLYICSGGMENSSSPEYFQDRFYLNDGSGNFTKIVNALPEENNSNAVVAAADYDKDGRTDLFVGGRLVPGNYGDAPNSYLLKNSSSNNDIKFINSTSGDAEDLQVLGMATDALWTDINKDGWPDLIVVGEWMSAKLFINHSGKLKDESEQYGLKDTHGLWTSISEFDLNGDGEMDYLLGNLGTNSQLNASIDEPMTLWVNDFLNTGTQLPILCYYIQGESYPLPSKDELIGALPALKKKFLHYDQYANAKIEDIFTANQLEGTKILKCQTTKNSWLRRSGEQEFKLEVLPNEAQFAPINGAVNIPSPTNAQNLVFAAGNFYPFRVQLGRVDAGKGLLISTVIKDGPSVIPHSSLGISADGDVRDVALIKHTDGQTSIIISKNNNKVQVLAPINN